jgi:hypothetical protein
MSPRAKQPAATAKRPPQPPPPAESHVLQAGLEPAPQPAPPPPPKERYWWVEWGPKAYPHQEETIRLWLNSGVGRRFNRGEPVIVPRAT